MFGVAQRPVLVYREPNVPGDFSPSMFGENGSKVSAWREVRQSCHACRRAHRKEMH